MSCRATPSPLRWRRRRRLPARARASAVAVQPAPSRGFGTLSEHLVWAVIGVGLVLASYLYYSSSSRLEFLFTAQWRLGLLSALGFLSAYAYVARKRWGLAYFRPRRHWYIAHIWLTSAGFFIGLVHAGFRLGGVVESALTLGFAVALASGFLLAVVHDRFKVWMVRLEGEHLLPEDLVDGLARRATETAELLAANRDEVRRLVETCIMPPLRSRHSALVCLRGREAVEEMRAGIEERDLQAVKGLSQEEKEVVKRVLASEVERRKLEVQRLLHVLRTRSVTVHVVLSSLVLGLLLLHVGLVLYY